MPTLELMPARTHTLTLAPALMHVLTPALAPLLAPITTLVLVPMPTLVLVPTLMLVRAPCTSISAGSCVYAYMPLGLRMHVHVRMFVARVPTCLNVCMQPKTWLRFAKLS